MRNTKSRLLVGTLILLSVLFMTFGLVKPHVSAASTVNILMYNGITTTTTNMIAPRFQVVNTSTAAINLADLKIRYYFTEESTQAQNFFCDWATVGAANVTGTFVTLSSPVTGADHYLEIGFTSAAGTLAPGATAELQNRIAKADWTNYDQSNDFSFRPTASTYAVWNNVTGSLAGALIWGTAPTGLGGTTPTPTTLPKTPTPTPTPLPKTPTPTLTPTPIPTLTPTLTPTPTPPPGTGCKAATFCDGFENQTGTVPSGAWQLSFPSCQGTGTATVDHTVAHTGTTSIRVDGHNGFCNHVYFGISSATLATAGPDLFVRYFVKHTIPLPIGHVAAVAMNDANDGNHDLRFGSQNSALQWNRSSDDATLPEQSPVGVSMSAPLPINQWSCVEFEVNQPQGMMRTWLNGTEVAGLHLDNVPTPDIDRQWISSRPNWRPALTDLRLGWESFAGGDDTLWYDDFAIGSHQIGCTV